MIVVASACGRGGIGSAMETLRRGGTALDAVVAGIDASERLREERRGGNQELNPPASSAPCGRVLAASDFVGTRPEVWARWRAQLAEALHLEPYALARMEWLTGLVTAVIGPSTPGGLVSFVACDRNHDLACGVAAPRALRVVLALQAGRDLGDALRETLADLDNLAPLLGDRINMHALARDRIPIGASHREGETFLYLHDEMAEYAERDCLLVG